jgi:glycosyltransferase involved in cell wall biosynthesis
LKVFKKISILLPVFNEEKYIKKCIQSILDSSYQNYEVVIVNDGSTDETLSIVNKIDDPRIKVYNKQNSGLTDSLNYGIDKCENEIIMRMDGDDLIHPLKIENQLDEFNRKDIILLGTEGVTINHENKKIKKNNFTFKTRGHCSKYVRL